MVSYVAPSDTPQVTDPNEVLNAVLSNIMAGGSTANPDDPPVYWGPVGGVSRRKPRGATMRVDADFYVAPKTDGFKTLSEAQMDFYNWSTAQKNEWGDYLVQVGYIDPEDKGDYAILLAAWRDVVQEAAGFTKAGKRLTPRQVAELIGAGKTTGKKASGESFTGTKSYSTTNVDLTDPATAKALVNQVLSDALGREANDDELRTFRNSLAAAERANPTTTTTSTTYNAGEAVSQASTTSGGLGGAGREQVLHDQAVQKPEYGAYQAARMVMGWLDQAISSPV